MGDPTEETVTVARAVYGRLASRVDAGRAALGRPLTFAEKVLLAHRVDPGGPAPERGTTYGAFAVDRVALQDALAQIVTLQFMVAGLDRVRVPTTVHCDHLIRARDGADADLAGALGANAEVYEFLRAACARYGMGFWRPGAGIIHQVVLEHHAFPGGMMIGTDSHTPNAGGLAMVAVGVGGGDAIDAMTGAPFSVRWPTLIGVHLTGTLPAWASPKDVVLEVARRLTVSGGTGSIVEYLGPGVASLSATGRATVTNMGAEVGATTSLFPYDGRTRAYLEATGRRAVAAAADGVATDLRADPEVEADPGAFFDRVVEVDLSGLVPLLNGPDAPDAAHRVDEVGAWAGEHDVPVALSAALIGSCTNSSYEDLSRVASLARQAAAAGLRARVPLYVTPGSEGVRSTVERDGLLGDLTAVGATVLANACGPCIGQWDRDPDRPGDPDGPTTIVTSFNRNFPGRNDGRTSTRAFVASPETVLAYALAGTLAFDPRTDPLPGTGVRLDPPVGDDLPAAGFTGGGTGFVPPPAPGSAPDVTVAADSERLQLLVPFPAWDGRDLVGLPVLVTSAGRCTTDQISPAGPWLRYRGHLGRISDNLFLGAVNAHTGATGTGRDPLDGAVRPFPEIARRLSDAGVRWCVVGDRNYGEGSSREHAAMEPRFRGCVAVLARSFARIAETNLQKQGILALTFVDPDDYDAVGESDTVSVVGLADLAPGRPVECRVTDPAGGSRTVRCTHTLDAERLAWFRAGSALNVVRLRAAGRD